MKILQVLPSLDAGGAEGFVTNLSVKLAERGNDVRMLLLAGVRGTRGEVLHARLRAAGVHVAGEDAVSARSPGTVVRLAGVLRTWQPDVVQANMYQAEAVVSAARILSGTAKPCYVRRLASTKQSIAKPHRGELIVRLATPMFDLTIACSAAAARAYEDLVGRVKGSRLVTIPNGGVLQPAPTTPKQRDAARDRLGIPREAFVVAHVGAMEGADRHGGMDMAADRKGTDVLIRSFAAAFPNDESAVLLLAGDGHLRPALEDLAACEGVGERSRFLGEVSEPWPVLHAADVFFFPSRHEGLPNALPEAASCGLPIVASNIDAIAALSPGDAWILSATDDADAFAASLLRMHRSLRSFTELARSVAPSFVERFSMDRCVTDYMRAYKEAVSRSGRHSPTPCQTDDAAV